MINADTFISDLDRCEHGRHQGDACFDCSATSLGNPRARGEDPRTENGEVILGYTIRSTHAYALVKPDELVWGQDPVRLVRLGRS